MDLIDRAVAVVGPDEREPARRQVGHRPDQLGQPLLRRDATERHHQRHVGRDAVVGAEAPALGRVVGVDAVRADHDAPGVDAVAHQLVTLE